MTKKTGYAPIAFVYPFGAACKESDSILKQMEFQATLTCKEKINLITRDPQCLYSLGRFLRPSGQSSETYFGKVGVKFLKSESEHRKTPGVFVVLLAFSIMMQLE